MTSTHKPDEPNMQDPPQPCAAPDPCVNPEDRPLKGMTLAEMLENYGLRSAREEKPKAPVVAKTTLATKHKAQAFSVDFGDDEPSGGNAPAKPFLKKKVVPLKPPAPTALKAKPM